MGTPSGPTGDNSPGEGGDGEPVQDVERGVDEWNGAQLTYYRDQILVHFTRSGVDDDVLWPELVREFEDTFAATLVVGPLPSGLHVFRLEARNGGPDSLDIARLLDSEREGHEPVTPGLDRLRARVETVHPEGSMSWAAWPNDPDVNLQWAINQVRLKEAWSKGAQGSPDVVIGIVDSGIPVTSAGVLTHPELDAPRYTFGRAQADLGQSFWPKHSNWIDYPSNSTAYPNDGVGHGTMVTGIAAAESDNFTHIAGVNWSSEVYVTCVSPREAEVGPAIEELAAWAQSSKKKMVINVSVAGCGSGTFDSCRKAIQAGAIVVAAAGNDNDCVTCNGICAPAKFSTHQDMNGALVAVGATALKISGSGIQEEVPPWSRTGQHITVVAPGGDIRSLDTGGGTTQDSGTSFSAPLVTGILSLIWSVDPTLSNTQVVKCLTDTAWLPPDKPKANVPYSDWGFGRVDAAAAVKCANPLGTFVVPTEVFEPWWRPLWRHKYFRTVCGWLWPWAPRGPRVYFRSADAERVSRKIAAIEPPPEADPGDEGRQ